MTQGRPRPETDTGAAVATSAYRGRFAPSPTGPLHFGSLLAAVASYLQARANHGEWLVRIEDIDPTREQADATERILRSLEAHGFEFDTPLYQSSRLTIYDEIIAELLHDGRAYACSCSRKELRATGQPGLAGTLYPGTCRSGADTSLRPATSVRLRTDTIDRVSFTDRLQGYMACNPQAQLGDFLVRRGDGLVAYQLAVVVDDHFQAITEVVRGTDLLAPTFMQLCLQSQLGYAQPDYMHIPVVNAADGQKLSKQTGAPALDDKQALKNLFKALRFLQIDLDSSFNVMSPKELLAHAVDHWQPALLQGVRSRTIGV